MHGVPFNGIMLDALSVAALSVCAIITLLAAVSLRFPELSSLGTLTLVVGLFMAAFSNALPLSAELWAAPAAIALGMGIAQFDRYRLQKQNFGEPQYVMRDLDVADDGDFIATLEHSDGGTFTLRGNADDIDGVLTLYMDQGLVDNRSVVSARERMIAAQREEGGVGA